MMKSLTLSLLLGLTFPIVAKADTTEDLLNVYGLTLGGPIRSDIERQMEEAEEQLGNALQLQRQTEEYNLVLEKYIENKYNKQEELNNAVNQYLNYLNSTANKIEKNILDGDINELIKDDNAYKVNNSYLTTLIDSLNYFQIDYSYRDDDFDISGITDKLYSARQLYSDSIDAMSIGDVKEIKYIMPITRGVNSSYGMRIDPIGRSSLKFHAGTDYYAPYGTEVRALFDGVVISSGWSNEMGYFITIQSGENIKYLVCHLSEILVSNGQVVEQYDKIALSGNTGSRCTGAHLHLALYINGVSYDVDALFTQN